MTLISSLRKGVFLLILISCLFSCDTAHNHANAPRAVNGLLDLRGWDFEARGPVFLNGEWRFFRRQDRTEPGIGPDVSSSGPGLIDVPDAWNNQVVQGEPLPGHGYGTYDLRILLPPSAGPLALKILDMATAFDLYVNHRKVMTAGVPGTTRETTRPAYRPGVVEFEHDGTSLDLTAIVSNFHHRQGGMWEPILLGTPPQLKRILDRSLMVGFLLFGSILIMGLYHLGLYYMRRADTSPLFFGLFCLLILVRMLTTGERYLVTLLPGLEWEALVKLIYISFYLCVPCFVLFVKSLFPRDIHSWAVGFIVGSGVLLSLLVLIAPARITSYTMPFFQALTLLAFLYGLARIGLAAAKKREGVWVFLAGFLFLFVVTVNDVLYTRQIIQTGHWFPLGVFVFILSQSFLLSSRFSKAFQTVEEQGRRLFLSEQKYRALFEDSLEAMDLTHKGRLVDANPAWLELHGYKKEEVLGTDILQFLHSEDRAALEERRENWPKRKGRVVHLRDLRKDGSTLDVEVYSSRIVLDGELFILATVKNVTETRREEERRKDLEKHLQRAQKMEAISAVAGGVAHDLNNILSGIVSYPDLILMQLPEDSPLRKPIEVMQQTGKKAATIVQDLLTLTRRGVPVEEPVSLNTLVAEYLESPEHAKLLTHHPLVVVDRRLDDDLMHTNGSPVHLAKTIMNLVSNGAEAMPEGGRLLIETANRSVDAPVTGYEEIPAGEYVTLTVSDTGVGILPKDEEKIFEPFYTKKVMGRTGTGLGMAVVWGTVKDHHGYLDVKSAPDTGTSFTVYLPATQARADAPRSEASWEQQQGNGERILVVDDSEEQRLIASSLLRKLGYNVAVAGSGEEAIAHVRESPVDLVLLDMIMAPGISGLETYQGIIEVRPGQRAIIASGFSETEQVRGAQRLGAGGYIKKPYTLETIGRAVRRELDR